MPKVSRHGPECDENIQIVTRLKTFWRRDSDPHEELRIEKGKLDDLSELADLLTQPSDLRVGNISRVLVGHVVDQGVNLSWKVSHDGQCCHIQCHPDITELLALKSLKTGKYC